MALHQERAFDVEIGGQIAQVSGSRVSGNLFRLLGVRARQGRVLQPQDQAADAGVVVLSHVLWRDRFGADPRVIGQTMRIGARAYEIVGVTPEHFGFPMYAQFWIPIPEHELLDRADRRFNVIARKRPGVADLDAGRELADIARQLSEEYPATNRDWGVTAVSLAESRAEPFFFTLVIAAVLVLLIACANIGNLLLARGAKRAGELAIRRMMGATRARLLRQLTIESATLAVIAGGIGVILSLWGVELLVALLPVDGIPLWLDFSLDLRVLAFTAAILVLAVLVFGVAPVVTMAGGDLHSETREHGRGIAGGRSATRTRNTLVIAQIALTLVLLSSAAVVMRSAMRTANVSPGYDVDRILQANLNISRRYPDQAARDNYIRDAMRELSRIPNVQSIAVHGVLPADSTGATRGYGVITASNGAFIPGAFYAAITPGYFETLGLSIVRGRAFDDRDAAGAAAVVILSEKTAAALWPGEDPIGRTVKFARPDGTAEWRTVVGIAGNRFSIARGRGGPPRRPTDEAYVPAAQGIAGDIDLSIRVRNAAPMLIANDTRRALNGIDPDQPIGRIIAMRDDVYANVRVLRWLAGIGGSFAAVSLVLASIGLFGVISYIVTQRTHEIGIRLALGASPASITRFMTNIGTRLVAIGIGIGLLVTLAAGQVLASIVYGVSARDPILLGAVALLLGGIAIAASWWPARRAARVDPVIALRVD